MRTIAHISDLHFGTEEDGLANGLLQDLREIQPSLIGISGDFTQRARRSQYRSACDFLKELPARWIAVPGNHDVPLYDLVRRFLFPFSRYRRFVATELNPFFEDDELMLLGLNTARSLTWKSGRISHEQVELIRSRMCAARPGKFKVLMTHHPFIPPPGQEVDGIDLVGRAAVAIPVIDQCRIDLLLAGHLHQGYSGNIRTYYPAARRGIVCIQAGTAISRRRRDEPNAYNVIRLEGSSIVIQLRLYRAPAFTPGQEVIYRLEGDHWQVAQDRTV